MKKAKRSFLRPTLILLLALFCGVYSIGRINQNSPLNSRAEVTPTRPKPANAPTVEPAKTPTPAPTDTPASSPVINTEFVQVGYFKDDSLRGFTYFVTNPNKQDIQAFCEQQQAAYPSNRILKIHFFDNLQYTPDVTSDYYFPESSDPYLMADYFSNPFNGEQGLKFHKDIPDQPNTSSPTNEANKESVDALATDAPAITPAPFVQAEKDVNLRSGPGTDYEVVGSLSPGQSFNIIGRNADSSWWQIAVDDKPVWVAASVVKATNIDQEIEVVEALPPPPTVTPIPPQAPAIAPTSTPLQSLPIAPPPARACCRTCSEGKACGDSCISKDKQCTKPPGCAC